jgi:hypothetical protein
MSKIQVYRPVLTDSTLPPAQIAPRNSGADGFRITLVNNGKPRTSELLTYMAEALGRRFTVTELHLHSKPSAGSPLDDALADRIAAASDLVITGLGDCGACSSCSLIDALMMEQRGIPASVVITDPFVDVCSRVSQRMGYAGYRPIMIPHPAASRDDIWLREWAERSVPILIENLLSPVEA